MDKNIKLVLFDLDGTLWDSCRVVAESWTQTMQQGCGSDRVFTVDDIKGVMGLTAADIAAENLEINGVSQKGKVFCGNVLDNENFCKEIFSKTYDVIVANIVADIIKEMTPLFKASLKNGGVLICSGIIGSRAEEVRTVLGENGFTIEETLEKNDWVAIKCKK